MIETKNQGRFNCGRVGQKSIKSLTLHYSPRPRILMTYEELHIEERAQLSLKSTCLKGHLRLKESCSVSVNS